MKRSMPIAILAAMAALAASGSAIPAARAESPVPSRLPEAKFRWVGPGGEVLKATWPFSSEWRWLKFLPLDPHDRPVFRTAVRIPDSVKIEKFEVSGGQITFVQSAEEKEATRKLGRQIMAVDTISPQTVVRLNLKDTEGNLASQMTLIIDLNETEPQIWTHESCLTENVRLRVKEKSALPHLFVGAHCKVEGEKLKLSLVWSAGVELRTATLAGKGAGLGKADPQRQLFEIAKPQPSAGAPPYDLGEFRLTGTQGFTKKQAAAYSVEWVPRREKPRFTHSASLGLSYLMYTEAPQSIRVNSGGLTGKYLFNYWLMPETTDISANGYITLLPLFSSASGPAGLDVQPSRYFGLNGRIGYQLGKESHGLGNFNMKFSLGWYLWGMLVPGANYGTSMVMGPQLLASVSGATLASGRSWSAYVKLAPISDSSFTVSLSSREIAAGGSYEITRVGIPHPIFLTLDLAHAAIQFTGVSNRITLLSSSLGVSYAL
ncbi:MAG: hypothetical protein NDJ89_04425 [Oligoflexia bacterium]|nr:hypothetical protein [Oligoflexia bacterium]